MKIAIASARNWDMVKPIAEDIGCDGAVTANGGVVEVEGIQYSAQIDRNAGELLVKGLLETKLGRQMIVVIDGISYANFVPTVSWLSPPVFTDFSTLPEGKIIKIMAMKECPEDEELLKTMIPEGCYYTVSLGTVMQVMSLQANKWDGARRLAEHWKIPVEGVVCFGDDYDDICMLEHAGRGVAMKNAIASVLEAAPNVTYKTNEEDGVADYLERLLKE